MLSATISSTLRPVPALNHTHPAKHEMMHPVKKKKLTPFAGLAMLHTQRNPFGCTTPATPYLKTISSQGQKYTHG